MWLEKAREDAEYKLRRWWSKARIEYCLTKYEYEKYVDETVRYHIERTILYENGLVQNLKRWRKALSECMDIIKDVEWTVRDEFKRKYLEYDDYNDPPMEKIQPPRYLKLGSHSVLFLSKQIVSDLVT
jgi:hypothetical protein